VKAAVFVRGVNTGGRALKTAEFARDLSDYDLRNIGAAGTFASRRVPSLFELKEAVRSRLPFTAEVIVVASDVLARLVTSCPFGDLPPKDGVRWAATILGRPPPSIPDILLLRPNAAEWEVRIFRTHGPFVLSESRRLSPRRVVYPNEVVEREFKVPATTRWWETVEQVYRMLEGAGPD
jgi:uncharacterized protein (DUF1697 family)